MFHGMFMACFQETWHVFPENMAWYFENMACYRKNMPWHEMETCPVLAFNNVMFWVGRVTNELI